MKAEEFRASYFQETAKRGCTRSCWDASSGSKQQPAVVRKIAMSDEWIQIDKINHVLLLRLGTKMPYPSGQNHGPREHGWFDTNNDRFCASIGAS